MHRSIPLELRILESRINAHIQTPVGWQTLFTIAFRGEKYNLGSDREQVVFDEPRAYRQSQRIYAVRYSTVH